MAYVDKAYILQPLTSSKGGDTRMAEDRPPDDEEKKDEEEQGVDKEELELLKLLEQESSDEIPEESDEEEPKNKPIDTDEKFITPDLIELPPRWFYEAVRDSPLPRGTKLTPKMKEILDKIYQGLSKSELTNKHGLSNSTINSAVRRIRQLWNMHKAGTLTMPEEKKDVVDEMLKKEKNKNTGPLNNTIYGMTKKTTTFHEIDKTIAEFLRPQIERSTQFQDVMSRIGLVTTYALMQLGVLDRSKFVLLAEAVADDPENLYKYVSTQLDVLINLVDPSKLKQFTRELLALREMNRKLMMKVQELNEELQKHRDWLYDAALVLSKVYDYVPYRARVELASWYTKYDALKRGGLVGAESGGEKEKEA